ncbi:MAG: hypothetical protein HPY54_15370 [Chthonomonadetes bacterium]|nr:hypothetical protein [Chthonomonadetes bacterium]
MVKLLEMEEEVLRSSGNPAALRLRGSPELLLEEKIGLTRQMEEMGYNRDVAYQLFRLLDWLVQLPEVYEVRYEQFLEAYHSEGKMAYLTTPERYALRRGMEQGLQEGIQQGLQAGMRRSILRALQKRFGDVSAELEERLERVQSEEALQQLFDLAMEVESLSAFEQALEQFQQ